MCIRAFATLILICIFMLDGCSTPNTLESNASEEISGLVNATYPTENIYDIVESSLPNDVTSQVADTEENALDDTEELIKEVHLHNINIRAYFNMTSDEIINEIGPDYEIVPAGAEGFLDGYYYRQIGMTFVFDFNTDKKLVFIDCNANCDILGAKPGMEFIEIQDLLGIAVIDEGFMEIPEYKTYLTSYFIDGCEYCFWSYSTSGEDSFLTIFES